MTESLYLPDVVLGVGLEAGPRGLRVIRFGAKVTADRPGAVVRLAERQLREYLAGERAAFDLPLDPEGTSFQLEVWQALCRIPYGQTRSYRDIARAVNRPKGFQAIGQANTRNPLPIVVPCHRVIAVDGTMGGYGGGLERKRLLLETEIRYADRFSETAA
ncbi:MAG TPA: methylated-DNA--[protein]-cysteine S-methyltransferase [Bryobacteraceae bacterium]|nr:methylated-DNA--[protein]-cysteine S-methyltransferase [Bryobacteraceae bacterium]